MDSLDIVLPEDRNIARENAISMLKKQLPLPYEFRYVTRNGETRWALESVSSINYQGKRATLGSFMDISETKRIEEQMIMSNKLVSLGELAAGVAHEINNPLTSVMGFAQLVMAREGVPQDIKEDLGKIYQESQRAVKIVQNLLSFARRSPADKSYTDMNEAIEKTLNLRSYKLKVSNITLATKFAADLPLVMADYNQIQQVILNIIINAEQAIAETKGKGKITVTTSRDKGCVRISIADNGPGIAPENITRVFDPFFTTKPVGKGSGLGLSVCHGIVTEHGGKIYVASTAGKGATFTIELPAVEGATARDGEKVTRKMQRRRRQKTSSILVVDDEPTICSILDRTLSEEGYKVDTATSGKAALTKLSKNGYDLCIADLKMPGMSGAEFFNIVKEKYPALAERMVFITGDIMSPETYEFLVSTGRPYLNKPLDLDYLMEVVAETLRGR